MKYLLDTNICVFVIRQKNTNLMDKLRSFKVEELAISSITLAELRYGASKSANPWKNHAALDLFLSPLAIVDFDVECAAVYGKVRAELERIGQPIGSFDTMIGAHAVRLSLPLVTNNTKEFKRISGLIIEDWSVGS